MAEEDLFNAGVLWYIIIPDDAPSIQQVFFFPKIYCCFDTNSLLHLRILLIKHNVVLDIMTVATAELPCQINPNMAPTGT